MKKAIYLCMATMVLAGCFVACSSGSIDNPQQNGISDGAYAADFPYSTFRYKSNEEFYQGFRDFDIDVLHEIKEIENKHMGDTSAITRITEDERSNGIFGSMRNKLLKEETAMIPYYMDKEIPYRNMEGFSNITLFVTEAFRKPCIWYHGVFSRSNIRFVVMYYDRDLLDEANEKGASWLIAQISYSGLNIDNYEQYNEESKIKDRTVYQKEIQLGDRVVISMVIDNSSNEPDLDSGVYFVYDDILVSLWGQLEALESILPDITFCEVSLPTNEPLRKEPGREGTKYSTKIFSE